MRKSKGKRSRWNWSPDIKFGSYVLIGQRKKNDVAVVLSIKGDLVEVAHPDNAKETLAREYLRAGGVSDRQRFLRAAMQHASQHAK